MIIWVANDEQVCVCARARAGQEKEHRAKGLQRAEMVLMRRLQWLGYVARMDCTHILKCVLVRLV